MPSLKGLINDRETLTIKAPDGELHITYAPSRLSVAYLEKYAEKVQAEYDSDGDESAVVSLHAELLKAVVTEWDLEGPIPAETVGDTEAGAVVPAGETIPLETEPLKWLGAPLLEYLLEELRGDAGVKVRKRGGSRGRS